MEGLFFYKLVVAGPIVRVANPSVGTSLLVSLASVLAKNHR
jgi:hypothetical protein